MSSDKRRRARVQGGWASSSPTKPPPARSDSNKPKPPSVPVWVGKNTDTGATSQPRKTYVYEEPNMNIASKVKETTIDHAGVYDLSTDADGVSRIRHFTKFIEPKECQWMFDQLFQEIPWKQLSDVKNGEKYLQPRLVSWYGDHSYSYSGVTHTTNSEWSPMLTMLKDRLEEETGCRFNSMLANLYRDGHDHVAWHSDDEPALGKNPTIASLSFGDTRMFELRKKPPQMAGQAELDYSQSELVHVPLDAGTLLIMEGTTQDKWQHRLCREYHDRGPRINLTFRVIYPET